MSDHIDDDAPDGMLIARILIERRMDEDGGVLDFVKATTGDPDEEMPLTDALGMMRLAEDSIIRARMEEE